MFSKSKFIHTDTNANTNIKTTLRKFTECPTIFRHTLFKLQFSTKQCSAFKKDKKIYKYKKEYKYKQKCEYKCIYTFKKIHTISRLQHASVMLKPNTPAIIYSFAGAYNCDGLLLHNPG